MNKKRFNFQIPILLILLFGVSCGPDPESSHSFYVAEPGGATEKLYDALDFEAVRLDRVESSFLGHIIIKNDFIHFLDQRFGWAFVFDSDGRFHDRRLGQGHGPSELPMTGIQFHTQTPDGRHVFIGSSFDVNVFDPDYQRLNSTDPLEKGQAHRIPPAEPNARRPPLLRTCLSCWKDPGRRQLCLSAFVFIGTR